VGSPQHQQMLSSKSTPAHFLLIDSGDLKPGGTSRWE
jgi:hypothetical protein